MNIKIRAAEYFDLENIFKLVSVFATSFKPNLKDFTYSFTEIQNNKQFACFVAEVDGKIVGYSLGLLHETFYANGKVSWLEEIMVDQDFRNLDIGTKLINEFEKWSTKNGSKLIALATRRSADFYKKNNYEDSAIYFRKLL